MDQINFYYLQRVLESELDLVQTNALASLKKARQDLGIMGAHSGGVVTQNAPPDLSVLVSGPGLCSDPAGERVYWAAQQTVDCSQDHLGGATAVTNILNERWISVIAEFDQVLSLPVTDGNGVTVYTRITDSFNLYVTMAVEQVIGTNLKPALPTDGVLLSDAKLVFGQVQILAADLDTSRRQDLIHETGSVIPTFYHGTLVDAVAALFGYVDALSSAVGVVFTATQTWLDASSIAAANVNGAINEILTDLKAWAGAARTGSAAHVTVGNYCDLANAALQTNLNTIADNVAGHINGGAPAHPDTAVTSAAQAGTPESWAGGSARGFMTGLLGHINDRTERATAEVISGAWRFFEGTVGPSVTAGIDGANPRFARKLFAQSIQGGSQDPFTTKARIAAGLYSGEYPWASPLSEANTIDNSAVGDQLADICVTFDAAGSRRIYVFDDATHKAYWFDPEDKTINGSWDFTGLFPAATGVWGVSSVCTDGTNLFISVWDTGGLNPHRIAACDQAGVALPGWGGSTALPGNGLSPLALSQTAKIIVAKINPATGLATRVCCANDWQDCGSGLSVTTIDASDGSIIASGDGSAAGYGTPANWYPSGGMCSDGVHVYVTACDPSGAPPVMTGAGFFHCNIDNPALFIALAGVPANISASRTQSIVWDGALLWVQSLLGLITTYEMASETLTVHSAGLGIGAARHAVLDGLNLWVQVKEAADDNILLKMIPCAEYQSTTAMDMTLCVRFSAGMTLEDEAAVMTTTRMGRMCFDGDSVWVIISEVGATTGSGIVRRVPRAGIR